MSRLPYQEGTWFVVPLRDGGFAVGVVARMAPRGRVLLGYFFGPRRDEVWSLDDVRHLVPEDATLVQRFGDLYLIEGRWSILGRVNSWRRESWPIPAFGRYVEIDGTAWRVEYDENNPNAIANEERISPQQADQLPNNALLGAGVVEAILTKQLGGTAATSRPASLNS